jgi:hypothetical protein
MTEKGVRSPAHPSPSRYSTELARQHKLGEGASLQRPRILRDALTLHPCYSSVRIKKCVVLCLTSSRQNFTIGLHSPPISALRWSPGFGGRVPRSKQFLAPQFERHAH